MPEKLLLTLENSFDVPPAYAMAWLTDFRSDDMRAVGGERMPEIAVGRTPEGHVTREFAMMGLQMRTETTLEPPSRWVASTQARDKKGRLVSRGRVEESVEPMGAGTRHRCKLYQEDLTFMARVMTTLSIPMQKRMLRKLFAHQKREMEAAFKAGKPPTA